ncbi:ubiquitin carboxyl-terminal hydrolase 10-A-like, partial [Ostrinia furnacalis]|uniref:ubiquitin carboxyl-terminal hydrolase 10-A-like n=1 Tax=Ostrinia furnacalis TaxID=93504 RepID=UPI00103AF48C
RRTPVADIFRGRTRLRLHRARAPRPPPHAPHLVTDAVQPFFTLQLDIEVRRGFMTSHAWSWNDTTKQKSVARACVYTALAAAPFFTLLLDIERRTPVADIFRGRTRLRLHRARAPRPPPHAPHLVTDAVQPFFTLQLDIERANSVKDALELLANKDTLEGVPDAWQQLSLEQLPVVLLLHLKCFQLDAEGHTAKIVKNIDYPVDLKIDPRIMTSKVKYTRIQRIYKLFAVVYHEGVEAVKGHYLTDTYHDQVGWI